MVAQMTVTSIWYLLLLALGFIFYYVVPRKSQWVVFLLMSITFFCLSTNLIALSMPVLSTMVAYFATKFFENDRKKEKRNILVLLISIVLIILPWLLLNAVSLLQSITVRLNHIIPSIQVYTGFPLISTLGMAYYTSQLISYVVDCYWENIERQSNPFKLITYTIFFAQLTTGPISRYSDLKTIYEGHTFSAKNLCFGAQRILWGFFKKLVIADRVGIIVNSIWNDLEVYDGFWRWEALLLYPILIYADFSGCMDIVIGSAEIFGIKLAENFNNPFFSKSIREFWSRWHITLGSWAKDYVMYPILISTQMVNVTKKAKLKFGKWFGKYLSAAVASGMVWLVMGVWHGSIKAIVGVSLYYWILIELGELFDPIWKKIFSIVQFDSEKFSWRLFQAIRTYLLYSFGAVFFRATSTREAINYIVSCFNFLICKETAKINPWILFDGSIVKTGITYAGINLIILGVLMMLIVACLREKYGYARNWIGKQGFIFRWIVWISLFLLVLIFGAYGPGYEASEFIYQRF